VTHLALEQARREDCLLIVGNGHEPTMVIGKVERDVDRLIENYG